MGLGLQVMKFGGTSVGDADCIARTAKIIAEAARVRPVIVVVSAMSGVTNRLIDAAKRAEAGEMAAGQTLAEALQKQHEVAAAQLIKNDAEWHLVKLRVETVLGEGQRLCEGTALLKELT